MTFEPAFFLLLFLSRLSFATPQIVRVEGSIFDAAGSPLTASKDIQIKAYDAASGGTLLWTSNVHNAAVSSGRFTINLDAATGSPSLVDRISSRTASEGIYFQVEVDSGAANGSMDSAQIVRPRVRAKGTMYALSAAKADGLSGVTATKSELNYLSGVTGNIQSQLNSVVGFTPVNKAGDTLTGNLGFVSLKGIPSGAPASPSAGSMFFSSSRSMPLYYDGTQWNTFDNNFWADRPPSTALYALLNSLQFEGSYFDRGFPLLATVTAPQGTVAFTTGKFGSAYEANEAGWISLARLPFSGFTATGLSISAWIKGSNTGSSGNSFEVQNTVVGDVDAAEMIGFGVDGGKLAVNAYTGSSIRSSASVSNNTWRHVAVVYTYNSGLTRWTAQLYVDGAASGSGNLPTAYNADYAFSSVGSSYYVFTKYHIDQLFTFAKSLSAAEVAQLAASDP